MKKITLFGLMFLFLGAVQAQNKVTENALLGTWKMVIQDLEDKKDKYKDDDRDRDDDNAKERFENAIEGAVNEFVSEMIGGIDIQFTFMKDHRAKMELDIMGEHETEYVEWEIDRNGYLIIKDDDDHEFDDDDVWMLEGNKLIAYDTKKGKLVREDDVYMIKVK